MQGSSKKYSHADFLADASTFRVLYENTRWFVLDWIFWSLYKDEENEADKRKIINEKKTELSRIWDQWITLMDRIEYEWFTHDPERANTYSSMTVSNELSDDPLSRAIQKGEGIQNTRDFWKFFHEYQDGIETYMERLLMHSHQWKPYRQLQLIRECNTLTSYFAVLWFSIFGFVPPKSSPA